MSNGPISTVDGDESPQAVVGPSPTKPAELGLTGALVRGTLWSVGMRWFVRLTGMLSTLVVARLLQPEDYGVIAMATLVIGLVQTFLDAGAANALLRVKDPDKAMADSAWTLNLSQALIVFVVVAAAAPFASTYFHEPRLTAVLIALVSTVVISGFGSMGPMLARKEFSYGLEVKIMLIARVVALGATILFAFLLRNYWALVIGALVGHVVSLASSYWMHPYRPRISFKHAREFWAFSQWMLISGIGVFLARKVDGFIVGRAGTASEVGLYNLSLEFGSMVTMELGAPLNRALLPVLATLQDQPLRLRDALMQTVGAVNLVTLPAGIGLAVVAPLAVEVFLGSQWAAAAPLLALFSFIGAIRFLVGPYYTLFLTVGRSRLLAVMSWFELAIFAVATYFLLPGGIAGIAQARLISCVIIVAVWVVLGQANGLGVRPLMAAVVRPLIGCGLMSAAIWALPPMHLLPVFELAVKIGVGGVVYLAWVAGAWFLQGKPDGFEKRIVEFLTAKYSHR